MSFLSPVHDHYATRAPEAKAHSNDDQITTSTIITLSLTVVLYCCVLAFVVYSNMHGLADDSASTILLGP